MAHREWGPSHRPWGAPPRSAVRWLLALVWAALALSGCFYIADDAPAAPLPAPDEQTTTPTPPLDNVIWLPQTVIEQPTPPGPAPATPTITDGDWQNEAFGVVWQRPDDRWTFYDADGLTEGFGQLLPLVTLALEDEASPRFVTLLRADLPPLLVRTFAQMVETNPDLALQSMAAGMGELGATAQLSVGELGRLPAVRVALETEHNGWNFIWIVSRPQAVFYVLAEGFGDVTEALPVVEALHFTDSTPAEQALADGAPPTTGPSRAQLVTIVEELRGLRTVSPVPFRSMPRDDLRAMLQQRAADDTDHNKTVATEALLQLLGLLPPDVDLLSTLLDFYGAEIAGFYDQAENAFILIGDPAAQDSSAPLSLREQVVFVHEYAHALQDQYFDLAGLMAERESRDDDGRAALLALMEGDAQMVTSLYVINYIGLDRTEELVAEASRQVDQAALERTPPFIRDSAILFPYVYGQSFIQTIFLNGGWEAVNALWQNPPISTEQILHPEKYPDDRPIAVSLPATLPAALGGNWHEALRNVWGEYALRLWLGEALGDGAADAAAGWDGDQYLFLTDGGRGLFILHTVWDTSEDADEAAAALRQWLAWRGLSPASGSRWLSDTHSGYVHVQFSRLFFAFADDARALNAALATLGWQ